MCRSVREGNAAVSRRGRYQRGEWRDRNPIARSVSIALAHGSSDGDGNGSTLNFNGDLSSPLRQILATDFPGSSVALYASELESLAGDTNLVLEALDGIAIEDFEDLSDKALLFAPGTGTIQFFADSSGDGIDGIAMLDPLGDTVKTNGRDLFLSGASMQLGNLDTSSTLQSGPGEQTLFAICD